MKILDEIIGSLTHGAEVTEIRACVHWTAVVSAQCGLASTGRDEDRHRGAPIREAGDLTGRSALEVAKLARSDSLREAALGIAAVNSLLEIEVDRCIEINAAELLMRKAAGKQLVIVGSFPFVPKLKESARELVVLERMPWPGTLPESEAGNVIPRADVVALTGSSFINHSFDDLLALCRPSAFVMILGPSTPMSPLLFDHGVDVLCGTQVVDIPLALRCISEGAIFRQVQGVRLLALSREER